MTADAMSCQKGIVEKVREGKADYVIARKGNQLHWCLDVIFDEDASKARKDNSPLNLNVLRKMALPLCKDTGMGKCVSLQKKRFRASLNPQAFLTILFG